MNENVNKGNSILKKESPVWEVKVGVYSPSLMNRLKKKAEIKFWETKVILN